MAPYARVNRCLGTAVRRRPVISVASPAVVSSMPRAPATRSATATVAGFACGCVGIVSRPRLGAWPAPAKLDTILPGTVPTCGVDYQLSSNRYLGFGSAWILIFSSTPDSDPGSAFLWRIPDPTSLNLKSNYNRIRVCTVPVPRSVICTGGKIMISVQIRDLDIKKAISVWYGTVWYGTYTANHAIIFGAPIIF